MTELQFDVTGEQFAEFANVDPMDWDVGAVTFEPVWQLDTDA